MGFDLERASTCEHCFKQIFIKPSLPAALLLSLILLPGLAWPHPRIWSPRVRNQDRLRDTVRKIILSHPGLVNRVIRDLCKLKGDQSPSKRVSQDRRPSTEVLADENTKNSRRMKRFGLNVMMIVRSADSLFRSMKRQSRCRSALLRLLKNV